MKEEFSNPLPSHTAHDAAAQFGDPPPIARVNERLVTCDDCGLELDLNSQAYSERWGQDDEGRGVIVYSHYLICPTVETMKPKLQLITDKKSIQDDRPGFQFRYFLYEILVVVSLTLGPFTIGVLVGKFFFGRG